MAAVATTLVTKTKTLKRNVMNARLMSGTDLSFAPAPAQRQD
jgi:hypothetical protein